MVMAKYAPLVFSRTAYIDFRPNFIAAPRYWTAEQRSRARDFVLAATDYADNLTNVPRWVMFSEADSVVAGVVALARRLSDTLTHELAPDLDGVEVAQRRLFAFVGAVFPIHSGAPVVPPMELDFYKKIYADTVGPRFFERLAEPNWQSATDMDFEEIEVDTISPGEAMSIAPGAVQLHPAGDEQSLWRHVAAGSGRMSLCTNVPPGRHKQFEKFDIITRADVTAVRSEPRTIPKSSAAPKVAQSSKRRSVDASHDLDAYDEAQKKKSESAASIGPRLLLISVVGGLLILGLATLALVWRSR